MDTPRNPTALLPQFKKPSDASKLPQIAALLGVLAMRRQADPTPETLQLFCCDLAEFEICDLAPALEKLGRSPREEYQSAFPDVGTLIEAVQAVRFKRREAERDIERRAEEKRWRDEWEREKAAEGQNAP